MVRVAVPSLGRPLWVFPSITSKLLQQCVSISLQIDLISAAYIRRALWFSGSWNGGLCRMAANARLTSHTVALNGRSRSCMFIVRDRSETEDGGVGVLKGVPKDNVVEIEEKKKKGGGD